MLLSKRTLKNSVKRLARRTFETGQRLGVDILPRHFYSETPAIFNLKSTDQWKKPFSMIGVKGSDINSQLEFVNECCTSSTKQALSTKRLFETASSLNGEEGFGPIEADFLYAFILAHKPQQVFQIGCGVSTAVCLQAIQDASYSCEVICVEPYPTNYLVEQSENKAIQLIREQAQLLDMGIIESLKPNLLFFVDSTHTLGPGGEVSRIILEMLPRLKPNAWVHFHDVLFPYDYDRSILNSALFFSHESILLHAFLAYNERFKLRASLSMLHYSVPESLTQVLPNYAPAGNDEGLHTAEGHFPSSAYIQVIA